MVWRSRVSSKGQVTIPVKVRERLGLEEGDVVVYEIEDEHAVLRRADPFDAAYHAAVSSTLDEAGLPRQCLVRLKLFTLDNRLILRRIGRLSDSDRRTVDASLSRHLPELAG